jgi:hypothetical protein
MIVPCIDASWRSTSPFGPEAFVEELGELGVALAPAADWPPAQGVCLWWAPLDIAALRARRDLDRLVVIPTDPGVTADNAERLRSELGLLGLIEPRAFGRLSRGMRVGEGLFGDPEVAAAAGLELRGERGLQGATWQGLAELVGRFLGGVS